MKNKSLIFGVCSSGGHLAELEEITKYFSNKYRLIICKDNITLNSCFSKVIFSRQNNQLLNISLSSVGRSLWRGFNTLLIAVYLLIKIRPTFLITTGAGVGTIFCIASKILFIPSIYICSITHIERIGISCKIAKYFATEFYVCHQSLAKKLNCNYFPNDAIRNL